MAYDAGGRLSSMTLPRGQYSYSYNPATGQLAQATGPSGSTIRYTYDGFLPLKESETGEVSGSVSRTYDNNFWVKSLAVNGQTVSFCYDNDGLLTSAGSLSLSRDAQNGLLTGTTLGAVQTAKTYNPFGELTSETVTVNGNPVMTTEYTRDKLGRITQKRETADGTTTTYGYSYDLAGRLLQVKKDGVVDATYTYDANGNRLSKVTPQGTESGTYDAQDRMTSYAGAAYTYTANGDLESQTESGATTTYAYDSLGNLTQVKLPGDDEQGCSNVAGAGCTGATVTIDYVIDARDRRVGKKVNGTLVQGFLYRDQLNPVAELDGSGNVVARFVYGSKTNVPDYMEKGGKTYRIVSDHLGSPRLVIDTSDGTVAQRMAYDEFGNVTEDTNPGFQPFGFAGGIYDQHIGLIRFGARDYDAQRGRWTSKDPIGFNGGDTGLYTYVQGDSLSYVDPRGLDIWVEGPSGPEPSFHESVNVGDPNGAYSSYSYGMNGHGLEGEVYQDRDHGGAIEAYKKTTPEQDAAFRKLMERKVGQTGIYGYDDICRSWSQRQFNNAPGSVTKPPVRVVVPQVTVSPSPSRSTTGTSSTTGTWTSR